MTFAVSFFLTVLSRVIPHPANFTPVGAFTIFTSKKFGIVRAVIFVILAMLVSDALIGFHYAQAFVYLGFVSYALWGSIAKSKIGILGASIGGSLSFFIISNIGVWLGPWYTHDLAGLVRCFTLALPFFRNTLLGDVVYTVAIFSAFAIYGKIKRGEKIWHTSLQQPILKRK
jgi:hypothetical protein